MSHFSQIIYAIVACIPTGSVATYGQLAALSGHPHAARQVGRFMALAPSALPCHRVVYDNGRLCPESVFGSADIQRQLLKAEGVPFLPDGRVDLSLCLFTPSKDALQFMEKNL